MNAPIEYGNSARGTSRGGSGEHGIPENGRPGDLGEQLSETIFLGSFGISCSLILIIILVQYSIIIE